MTDIYELNEGSTDIHCVASFSLPPDKAMVTYIEQGIFGNMNTGTYPDILPGMRESRIIPGHWYYDAQNPDRVIAAYPRKEQVHE